MRHRHSRPFPSLVLILSLVLAPCAARGGEFAPPDSAAERRALADSIDALRHRTKQSGAPDSLRRELARLYQSTGAIEDRTKALVLYDTIRRSYQGDPEYHRERARLFERCQQPSRAREALEDLLALAPHDVEARVEIARLRLRELSWQFDLALAGPILEVLGPARADAPDNRDALYFSSLAVALSGERAGRRSPALSGEGADYARAILARHPEDAAAHLLLAVHLLDEGMMDEAADTFAAALESGPADTRAAFTSARWAVASGDPAPPAGATPAELARYDRLEWRRVDPTPLTARNENQLILWKRLTLADPLFGLPERGLRGWDTPPGDAFVRYGEPVGHEFDPGQVWAGPDDSVTMPRVDVNVSPPDKRIRLVPTAWSWRYHFPGIDFDLRFEDRGLNGIYRADNATGQTLAMLRRETPVIFQETAPGSIQQIYLASSGVRGEADQVRQEIGVAVPFWRKGLDPQLMQKIRLDIVVRDSTRAIARQSTHFAAAEDVFSPEPGLSLLLYAPSFDLAPGSYSVSALVSDPGRQIHGAATTLVQVRDYDAQPGLEVSDLELSFRADSSTVGPTRTRLGRAGVPNPMALVGADSTIDVYYEMYGLTAPQGVAQAQVRYTVLPRGYLLAFDRQVHEHRALPQDLLKIAEAGRSRGESGLTATNTLQVVFPPATVRVIDGRATRATRVSLAGLEPGEYGFVVSVQDGANNATASAVTLLRIMDDGQRADLRRYAARE